jgi:hypothetical protein
MDFVQAASYAAALPQGRPDVAGVLYLLVCSQGFAVAWSDASRVVCSQPIAWDNPESGNILSRYVGTLYRPKMGLYQVDKTIKFDHLLQSEIKWRIQAKGVSYIGDRLRSSPAYGKQTFVWRAKRLEDLEEEDLTYIIKDCWANSSKRYREIDLYDKVRGVRGFAQMLVGEKIPELTTSDLHSGAAHDVPKRNKERLVLATSGDPLSHRSSLLQFFKAMYDVVQSASLDLFSLE